VLNPARGTFHPKPYLARHGDEIAPAVGSANLTSRPIANVEIVTAFRGGDTAPQLVCLLELAESWWDPEDTVDWSPRDRHSSLRTLAPDRLRQIQAANRGNPEVLTLADHRPNRDRPGHARRRLG